jgi:cytoskeletal protein CcmA (bactofilin family)
MRIEDGKIEGDIQLDQELTLSGMVTGNIIVVDGGLLNLNGTCCKDLTLQEGAKVYLRGTVGGSVFNRGGYVEIYGTVAGSLHTTEEGSTFVDPHAVVKGNK